MFEHMQQWKKDGKIRHIGFSYHDSADNLDKILSEHPEVEFVQNALNYIDWEAYNNCMLQPNPGFAAEHNYFSTEKAKHGIKTEESCIPLPAVLSDGTDISDMVKEAEEFLNSNAFFQYEVQ